MTGRELDMLFQFPKKSFISLVVYARFIEITLIVTSVSISCLIRWFFFLIRSCSINGQSGRQQ